MMSSEALFFPRGRCWSALGCRLPATLSCRDGASISSAVHVGAKQPKERQFVKDDVARKPSRLIAFAAVPSAHWAWVRRRRREKRQVVARPASSATTAEWTASWHKKRLDDAAANLDWSRVFVSVLFVDSPSEPAYVRARLVQRLVDAVAEWNGLGKVIEVYACTPRSAAAIASDEDLDFARNFGDGYLSARAAAEFAHNVGLDEGQLQQILRKLGAGWSAQLCQEPLREHDIIVALDRVGLDAAAVELRRQGITPTDSSVLLLSDFVWHYEASQEEISSAACQDGSGTGFLDEKMERALTRFEFEQRSKANLQNVAPLAAGDALGVSMASGALDTPAWPYDPRGDRMPSRPGEWRKLHGTLLKGCAGLAWFLVSDWKRKYCNPLR